MKKFLSVLLFIVLAGAAIKTLTGCISSPSHTTVDQAGKYPVKPNAIKNMFGINCYEWNFLNNPFNINDVSHIYDPKMDVIKSFTGVRHYMDWSKIEATQGNYTFNPTHDGGWNFDAIYEGCKKNGIEVLVCLKTCPQWLVNTYPPGERDNENVPAPYSLSHSDPASYILQAKAGFQFAARYGYNKKVDPALVKVDSKPRWTGDQVNQPQIGMGLVKYIECDNERDKWWKGKRAQQNGSEYAANLSAFYDGDKGKLGKGVGVKNADPNMQVVMTGLASANVQFVKDMVEWCKKNRGYKPDGSIDLCFDVINYHFAPNDHKEHANGQATRGIAPELSEAGETADGFVSLSNSLKQHPPVWITETCYDINPGSPQRAIAIGNERTAVETQGDWLLRAALLYNRHGIKRAFYYQLFDDNGSAVQYSTSGLADGKTLERRPAADYALQVTKLMGNYEYKATISQDPLVDVYQLGDKKMFVLMIPDEKGRTGHFMLDLGKAKTALVHNLQIGKSTMGSTPEATTNGKFDMYVTETPIFVEVQ
ncbi:alpha-amylase family protein [Mucilaginibacter paludis]|uniref:Glycoside hydrolase family 42 N-terminal domain-containing protein n=1 Tax=Mucilaginibacter paludis DSM 18603 TaxID=714943 RepID=H1Y1Z6_9SPHI|nr:hypothetical protein [Mucilaginibacter paludis]EHQ25699.1 hypothetical protein Mucpa_1541 [Mucilaginibacter paludis DSM 18603]